MVNDSTTNGLLDTCFAMAAQPDVSELYILLNTPGGNVNCGIGAHNILSGLDIPITMHNVGSVESIGGPIFLAGNRRFACEDSTFLFHGVTQGVGQGAELDHDKVKEILSSFEKNEERIKSIISRESSIDPSKLDKFFSTGEMVNAQFALQNGIVHGIGPSNIPSSARVIQLRF